MKYLLDTNVCVGILRGKAPKSRTRLLVTKQSLVCLCSIVRYELLAGAQSSSSPEQELAKVVEWTAFFESLPFDDRAAAFAAQIRAQLEKVGTPIGPHDIQIAAIALLHNLIVVTGNTCEFQRVPGLKVEDWES
jgi:tRNA(fMet)-specific endonuclease VapC